jgi:hypothetical protein
MTLSLIACLGFAALTFILGVVIGLLITAVLYAHKVNDGYDLTIIQGVHTWRPRG